MSDQPGPISMSFFMVIVALVLVSILSWLGFWLYIPAIIFLALAWGVYKVGTDGENAKINRFDWVPFATGALASICLAMYLGIVGDVTDIPVAELPTVVAAQNQIPKKLTDSTKASKKIIRTNVDEILDAYEANQIGALKKFGNATLKITGEVIRVREAMGTGIIVMRSQNNDRELELYFADSATNMLAPLDPGEIIEATCPDILEVMSVVVVGGCLDVAGR